MKPHSFKEMHWNLIQHCFVSFVPGCSQTFTGDRGVIKSPNHPDNHPVSLDCSYLVQVPSGNIVALSFSHFDLEPSESKLLDYVAISTNFWTLCQYLLKRHLRTISLYCYNYSYLLQKRDPGHVLRNREYHLLGTSIATVAVTFAALVQLPSTIEKL